jgi:hypothetical protein
VLAGHSFGGLVLLTIGDSRSKTEHYSEAWHA